jgi:hypothetical protein
VSAKVHLMDIRLRVNAGMAFPACCAKAPLLDTDKSHWVTSAFKANVTCKRCLKLPRREW